MKKLVITLLLILVLSACSTLKLYNFAIDYERGGADFVVKKSQTKFGEITYLDNEVKSKTTLVLLHGFGGDKDNWNRFSSKLGKRYRIIAPDLPGHGDSMNETSLDYSLSNVTNIITHFLESIDISNMHLVGNSLGGAIAIEYAIQHKNKVKSLTLIDSLGIRKIQSEFDKVLTTTGKNPLTPICDETAFNNLLKFGMLNPPYIPGIFMEILVTKKCERAEVEALIFTNLIQNSDLRHELSKINTPTLIIWGDKDRILHVDNAQLFQNAIKGSQLEIFKEMGHVPLIENPKMTANIVMNFINKNSANN